MSLEELVAAEAAQSVRIMDQAYDFATARLTTRLTFRSRGTVANLILLTFCSTNSLRLVCQQVTIETDRACDLRLRAQIEPSRDRRPASAIHP